MMRDAEALGLSMDEMGASGMACAERREGKDASLRRIARAIITAQAKEMRQMNAWRKRWYGATSPSGGVPRS